MEQVTLFGQMCAEAMMAACERDLQADGAAVVRPSAAHRRQMRRILAGKPSAPARAPLPLKRRLVIAALVAALLFLTACGTYIWREELAGYWVELYEDHFFIKGDMAESGSKITEQYCLTYVPEGYTLTEERVAADVVYRRWENETGDGLALMQTCHVWNAGVDNKGVPPQELLLAGNEVMYLTNGKYGTYMWSDGVYHFTLNTTMPLSQEVLQNLFQGFEKIKIPE